MSDDPIAILTASRASLPEHHSRPHLWPLIAIIVVLLAAAVVYFGDQGQVGVVGPTVSGTTTDREPRIYVVSYRFGVFSPTNLRIHAGDTVRFRNDSPLPIRIVAELQPGERTPEFDSAGDVQPGSYFSYTFPRTGVFGYYNDDNRNESGVVIVR